jgi:DNA polymerase-3 subunit delta
VEVFEGDAATPEAVGAALNAMTFAVGRRFLIVDGVERWKDAEVEADLLPALKDVPPDTTVAFFAREDGRVKAPANLVAVVKKVGNVAVEATPKAKDLPNWAIAEAKGLGVTLERPAAQLLVTHVGERQQRLLRELEKLAIEYGPGATLGTDEVESAAHSAERQVWGLVDSFVAGNGPASARAFMELRAQGESIARLGAAHGPARARRARDREAARGAASRRRRSRSRSAATRGRSISASSRRARPTPTACAGRSRRSRTSRSPAAAGSELEDDTVALLALR